MYSYSPSTHWIYDKSALSIYVAVPTDLIDITDEQVSAVMQDKPLGAVIYHDADMTLHVSSAPPTFEHSFNYETLQWELDPAKVEAARRAAIPAQITMRQARLALLRSGKLDDAEAAINGIPDATLRRAAQIEWEYAQGIERNSPLVQQVARALQINDQQLDDLFSLAGSL